MTDESATPSFDQFQDGDHITMVVTMMSELGQGWLRTTHGIVCCFFKLVNKKW